VENVANIFCVVLVMFYLLLLSVLVLAPLLKQKRLEPSIRDQENRARRRPFRTSAKQ
jgi:hypothetical protein